jgi:hypothetical protein
MAVLVRWGALSDTVRPVKGTAFNLFWEADVLPGVESPVCLLMVPADPGTPTTYVNLLHVTGRINCIVTLKRVGNVLYRGRMDLIRCDLTIRFDDCEHVVIPGQAVQVYIEHEYPATLTFAGNLGGFRR